MTSSEMKPCFYLFLFTLSISLFLFLLQDINKPHCSQSQEDATVILILPLSEIVIILFIMDVFALTLFLKVLH